jgi:hypothetical protein
LNRKIDLSKAVIVLCYQKKMALWVVDFCDENQYYGLKRGVSHTISFLCCGRNKIVALKIIVFDLTVSASYIWAAFPLILPSAFVKRLAYALPTGPSCLLPSVLKMETTSYSETLVSAYKTTA